MGTFTVEVLIGPARAGDATSVPVKCLVDTGAAFCQLPASLLSRLGITPERRVPVILADGTERDQLAAWVEVRYGERAAFALVRFGDETSLSLLGAHALEGLGLAVDPVRRVLEPARFPLA